MTITPEVPVIVVDCGCPPSICRQLAELKSRRDFQWLHSDCFLLPHEARNRALPLVQTPFLVFADNDLCYEPGWLEALQEHAEQKGADVVAPLICIGPPIAKKIHHAGGELYWRDEQGERHVDEVHRLVNQTLDDRLTADLWALPDNRGVEFHCFMMRCDALQKIGGLDDRLICAEHIDFVLRCLLNDLKIGFEKDAVVTYMAKQHFSFQDFSYFFFRWNLARVIESLKIIEDFWGFPVKKVKEQYQWVRRHQQRAIATFFPIWMAKRISHKWLLHLFRPYRHLFVHFVEKQRQRVACPLVVASHPDREKITGLMASIPQMP